MGELKDQLKVTAKMTAKKTKETAKKAKKVIVKSGVKVAGACKKGWSKVKKSIKELKNKNKKTQYLGVGH